MPDKRSFTVVSTPKNRGTYMSNDPGAAAKKAATQLFKKASPAKSQITFEIRETTQGSPKKTFKYTGRRTKLSTPKVVNIKGKLITYKHKISAYVYVDPKYRPVAA
jgi:hypothetical protein